MCIQQICTVVGTRHCTPACGGFPPTDCHMVSGIRAYRYGIDALHLAVDINHLRHYAESSQKWIRSPCLQCPLHNRHFLLAPAVSKHWKLHSVQPPLSASSYVDIAPPKAGDFGQCRKVSHTAACIECDPYSTSVGRQASRSQQLYLFSDHRHSESSSQCQGN